jgi:uncharacterized SAM-binding protein YcdF (DUF218 family)
MIIPAFIFLILAAAGFSRCGMRRTCLAVRICTLLLFFVVGCGVLPAWLLRHLQPAYATTVQDWGTNNAIVVLGVGSVRTGDTGTVEVGTFAYGRLGRALQLYESCKRKATACRIVVSGGDPQRNGRAEAVVYDAWLQQAGVPQADLILEADSMNTWQNAQFCAPLLKRMQFDRTVLLTSALHMPRSLAYFAHFGIHPLPVRAEALPLSVGWLPSSYHFFVTDIALHEYVGMLRYRVYEYLGWNSASAAAGAA